MRSKHDESTPMSWVIHKMQLNLNNLALLSSLCHNFHSFEVYHPKTVNCISCFTTINVIRGQCVLSVQVDLKHLRMLRALYICFSMRHYNIFSISEWYYGPMDLIVAFRVHGFRVHRSKIIIKCTLKDGCIVE